MRKTIEFASPFDGTLRKAVLMGPDDAGGKALPLVLVPHAAGFTAEATAAYWRDIPAKRGVLAVFPIGHPRRLELFSLGWQGQLADMASMHTILFELGYPVDNDRIYTVGISMGGLESLLLAAYYPKLLTGVVTFNAVVDLSTWYSEADFAQENMIEEIGGTPEEVPEAYAERSPVNYPATISRVPVLLYWDPEDEVVEHQDDRQSGLLFRRVKEVDPNAPIWARTHNHGHYWTRPNLALDWLLETRC